MNTSRERPTVAVVGAGFSGLMVALNLSARPDAPDVSLVERGAQVARGVAYSALWPDPRLNVRAANMGAFPDRPRHFLDWLEAQGEGGEGAFARRARYGDYLQALLAAVEPGRVRVERAAAVGLAPRDAGWRLALAGGGRIDADAVVLALGNPAPRTPHELDDAAAASPAYVADPWSSALDAVGDGGCTVLLGAGLTMVDAALHLARSRPGLRLLALSRRGLAPRAHVAATAAPQPWSPHDPASAVGVMRELRARAGDGDWRPAVDGLRPQLQGLWRGWPLAERRRFLRHLRPWWDVHRHRVAPEVAAALQALVADDRLAIRAGRLLHVGVAGDGLAVTWRPRGERTQARLEATALVNCTGPDSSLARAGDPLLADLAERGLARPDPSGLGVDVDADGRLRGADGRASPSLFAMGPMTQGAFWEITSAPDIRGQAARTAETVAAALAGRAPQQRG